ncbi:TetR/AcrR family transcriptional regulator [Cellulomonas sp. DKR-3]|uniref:TetR/AcrR family transcriptional regulator n=1 Tax=Cellulomonas fulva TaxID=2835530 RepID=A0ABS5TZ54_9CELL|nr:TetR-like C-terminal domain-containing protein [Cellulomonas fulva]MBT0994419.1 TetR/AcrR family transcriptional regulator [Cellulomonas fulva]
MPSTHDAPSTPRARARAAFEADLLAAARARIADEGAAQLSLRAVARDLGVASSAIYRYVASRDALLTLLVVEAYDEVGEACERALADAAAAGRSSGERWVAIGRAFRAWAVGNRHSYALVYGTPVPGYVAPQDTVAHASRTWAAIGSVLVHAHAAGEITSAPPDARSAGLVEPGVLAMAAGLGDGSGALDDAELAALVVRSLTMFESLVGAVAAELFGHLAGVVTDRARAFDLTLASVAAGVGLPVALDG